MGNQTAKCAAARVRSRRRRIGQARREWAVFKAKRAFLIIFACAVLTLAGYGGIFGFGGGEAGLAYTALAAEETVYTTVIVERGDTVWGIAGRYVSPKEDIRAVVKEICELNGVEAGSIYPGQGLIVPVPAHMV